MNESMRKQLADAGIDVNALLVTKLNLLPIGETCVTFRAGEHRWQAYFRTSDSVLVSLLLISNPCEVRS